MGKLLELLQGKKTYLVSLAMVLYAVLGFALGQLDQEMTVQLVLSALGLSALRAGISKG